jgi:hypothetical protein
MCGKARAFTGSLLTETPPRFFGAAPRRSEEKKEMKLYGKAKPFRTSSGRAAKNQGRVKSNTRLAKIARRDQECGVTADSRTSSYS